MSSKDPKQWFNQDCLQDTDCLAFVHHIAQIQFILKEGFLQSGFGSLLQLFSETVYGHGFHPEAAYNENKIILDQVRYSSKEETIKGL